MARGFGNSVSLLAGLIAVAATTAACSGVPENDDSTTSESNLSAGQCAAAKPWAPNVAYKVGDVVSFEGAVFVVRQAHTSLSVWPPPIVPALFLPAGCNAAAPAPPATTKPPPAATTPPKPPPPPPPPPANNSTGGATGGGGAQTGAAAG